jgi:hypothetical protein
MWRETQTNQASANKLKPRYFINTEELEHEHVNFYHHIHDIIFNAAWSTAGLVA